MMTTILEQIFAAEKSYPRKGEARQRGAGAVRAAAQAEVHAGQSVCVCLLWRGMTD